LISYLIALYMYVFEVSYLSLILARQGSFQDNVEFGRKAALLLMCGLSIVEQRQEMDNGTKAGNAS
jgi:hypothetical protein